MTGFRRVPKAHGKCAKHLYRNEYDSHNGRASAAHFKKRHLARLARRNERSEIEEALNEQQS